MATIKGDPSREELHKLLVRGQNSVSAVNERITQLQQMQPGEYLTGRTNLGAWDRHTVTYLGELLDRMEQIERPSREQRLTMAELHKLIDLGEVMVVRNDIMLDLMKEKSPKFHKRGKVSSASNLPNSAVEVEEGSNGGPMPSNRPAVSKAPSVAPEAPLPEPSEPRINAVPTPSGAFTQADVASIATEVPVPAPSSSQTNVGAAPLHSSARSKAPSIVPEAATTGMSEARTNIGPTPSRESARSKAPSLAPKPAMPAASEPQANAPPSPDPKMEPVAEPKSTFEPTDEAGPGPEPESAPEPEPEPEAVVDEPKEERANNLLAYDMLGVSPDTPLPEIKKAIRKQIMQRHPDRLPGVADASSKFADFQIVCAVFNNDATRQEYDQTGEVEDVEDLAALVKRLKMS